nr:fatty-acid--CoA ligase [Gordonia sp. (in: high G+C Gram-positive bacteria)]
MLNTELSEFVDEDGHLRLQENVTLVAYVERNVREQADTLAYRFIDYSRERDGEPQDLTWAQFGKRLRAVAARLQQVTARGDRV